MYFLSCNTRRFVLTPRQDGGKLRRKEAPLLATSDYGSVLFMDRERSETEKYLSTKRNSTPEPSRHRGPWFNYRDGRAHSVSVSSSSRTTDNLQGSNADAASTISNRQNDSTEKAPVSVPGTSTASNGGEKILRPRDLQKFLAWTLIMCKKVR